MKKHSREWKLAKKVWVQAAKHSDGSRYYTIHRIENDNEYSSGYYLSYSEAVQARKTIYGF